MCENSELCRNVDAVCCLSHNVSAKFFLINEHIFSIFEVLTVEEVWCLTLTMKYPSTQDRSIDLILERFCDILFRVYKFGFKHVLP